MYLFSIRGEPGYPGMSGPEVSTSRLYTLLFLHTSSFRVLLVLQVAQVRKVIAVKMVSDVMVSLAHLVLKECVVKRA